MTVSVVIAGKIGARDMQVNDYNEVLPRLELGLPDSKSEVLTNYTIEPHFI